MWRMFMNGTATVEEKIAVAEAGKTSAAKPGAGVSGAIPAGAILSGAIFDAENPGFKADFDELPFEFNHCFTNDHPMFQRERMRKIFDDERLKHHAYYDHGAIPVDFRWENLPERKMSSKEVFDNIGDCQGWMMLRHLEKDPEYNELLKQCPNEGQALTGR